ncbi:TniQ family protein [Actinacidiphila epipremni]|uniref:LysR family transcriptional regulator n=1 Tax=Actinacidiphila epipremni TaxID=2053013 RepID=A0ABX0ZMW5_9ACTN|nr:TniQ family protein [Actinacidiphila epipremni]NJP42973.1 LysR family transcriptional regulator [Actinacidiphila epipremni]
MTEILRTLPIRVVPRPGESLDSWLEALAHRNRVDFREILVSLGLHHRRGGEIPDHTIYLQPEEARRAAAASGVPAKQLHTMTLRQYDGHAVVLHAERRSVNRMQLWGRAGSRFCPECLREQDGRWQVRWRLPWSFACVRHRTLLAHACPACGQRARHGRVTLYRAIPPHQCSRSLERSGPFCQADLTLTPTTPISSGSPVLAAQECINDLLSQVESGQPDGQLEPRSFFNDLRALAGWTLRGARPGDFHGLGHHIERACQEYSGDGRFSPASAAVTAGGLTRAVQFLQDGSSQDNIAAVRALIERDGERLDLMPPGDVNKRWKTHSSGLQQLIWRAMDPRLETVERLRYRSCTSRPCPPEKDDPRITARVARIPQLLWRGWTARLMPTTGVRHVNKFRGALAVALLLPGWSKRRFDPLIGMLHHNRKIDIHYMLAELAQQGHGSVFTALCEIAEHLDTCPIPIDYGRRRKLDGSGLLPADAWMTICANTGIHPGHDMRLLTMRRYLYQRITGNNLRQASAPLQIKTNTEAAALAEIPFRITAALLRALDDHASAYLRDLSIDEPPTWEPPAGLTADLSLPGQQVNIQKAHRLICIDDQAPAAAAKQMGVTLESLRHCFEEHPPDVPWPSNGRGSWIDPTKPLARRSRLAAAQSRHRAQNLLTDEFLRHEYVESRKPIKKIAAETGLPKVLISERLDHAGLLTSRKSPRANHIDEQWLRDQYLRQARSLASIAAELGMSDTHLGRRARAMGIELRPRGGHHIVSPAGLDALPPFLKPALTDRRGWGRLQRFRHAMEHRTITEAAFHLGIRQAVLSDQIARLEKDLGAPLYIRPHRGESLRPTPIGLVVLDVSATINASSLYRCSG